jgi:hypothetical protein
VVGLKDLAEGVKSVSSEVEQSIVVLAVEKLGPMLMAQAVAVDQDLEQIAVAYEPLRQLPEITEDHGWWAL